MALEYKSRDGDTVDLIAYRHYGNTSDSTIEQVLLANRGVADLGPILPAGVTLILPDITQPHTQDEIRLWR